MILILFTNLTLYVVDSKPLNNKIEKKVDISPYNIEMAIVANYIFLQSPLNNSIITSDTEIVLDIDDSLLSIDKNYIHTTDRGFLFLNEILEKLLVE